LSADALQRAESILRNTATKYYMQIVVVSAAATTPAINDDDDDGAITTTVAIAVVTVMKIIQKTAYFSGPLNHLKLILLWE
jgi:hypothetical protein